MRPFAVVLDTDAASRLVLEFGVEDGTNKLTVVREKLVEGVWANSGTKLELSPYEQEVLRKFLESVDDI